MTLKIVGGPAATDCRVLDAETGQDLTDIIAVQSITISIRANELVVGKAEIAMLETDVSADSVEWLIKHPLSDEYAPVRAIDFADGARIEFAPGGRPTVTGPEAAHG